MDQQQQQQTIEDEKVLQDQMESSQGSSTKESESNNRERDKSRRPSYNSKEKEHIADLFLLSMITTWKTIRKTGHKILIDFRFYETVRCVSKVLARHPFLSLALSGLFIILSLPFILFTMFAVTTAIITFMGFIMVEGTLITIATVLLFSFVGCFMIMLLFFSGAVLTGYFGFLQIQEIFTAKQKKNRRIILS